MRSCNNRITTDELRRFVFRLHRSEDIENVITLIHNYRRDLENGVDENTINQRYMPPLSGAVGEPKYIMARAGRHIGRHPSLINKPTPSTYELNPVYFDLIDNIIENEPIYKDYLDNETWMRDYGQPVEIDPQVIPFSTFQP